MTLITLENKILSQLQIKVLPMQKILKILKIDLMEFTSAQMIFCYKSALARK